MTRFGLQLWSQQTDWPGFRDAALAAEAAGWDSVWTWDHLMAIFGPWEQPIFEGWSVLAGLAPITSRVRLGLMVGANTFRNPGHTAKLATTLDHLSGGRAVLGIGGAWFEREHDAYGIDFFSGHGERLDRLDEAVMLMRRLLDGERFSHEGRFYTFHDALVAPRPVQSHLPILVGGSGPRKTLRTVALRADGWNTERHDRGGPRASSTSWPSTAPTSGATWPGSRRRSASRSSSATTGRRPRRRTGRCSRRNGIETMERQRGAARVPDRGGRRAPARTSSSASRPSSSGCPRRTTARRSTGWRASPSSWPEAILGGCTGIDGDRTMVSGRAGTALKRAGRWPFHAVGLEVVRKGQQPKASKRVFPAWDDRLRHARDLGFAPGVIVDGGAFRGYWSRDVAALFPGAQLVMIEPNPHAREVIATTVAAVRPAPIVVDVAIGDAAGSAQLAHLAGGRLGPRRVAARERQGRGEAAGRRGGAHARQRLRRPRLVPDLLKLDLQGGELAALRGATKALQRSEMMMIEFGCLEAYVGRTTPRDLIDIMFDHDFCLYDVVDCHYRPYDGALTGGDFIFVKNSSALRAYKGWE